MVAATAGVGCAGGIAGACVDPVAAAWPAQAARIETRDTKTMVNANFLFMGCVLLISNIFTSMFFGLIQLSDCSFHRELSRRDS